MMIGVGAEASSGLEWTYCGDSGRFERGGGLG